MVPDANVSAQLTAWWFHLIVVPEKELSLDGSKDLMLHSSYQIPTSTVKAGPVNEQDTHPVKTLSKYMLRSWVLSERLSSWFLHPSVNVNKGMYCPRLFRQTSGRCRHVLQLCPWWKKKIVLLSFFFLALCLVPWYSCLNENVLTPAGL